ncbi:hypothetical protein Ahy_A10g050394 isoform B [Arachis hypogaea]|uniref:Uncharacterized protein n=1 Tax=Arachis hypogaea TaxID=3818 RepID=A0A445B9C0_ARAHY|nr:hypothetical protein Ahy_A10g050394 isoform B [Arachis hypogaea]
MDNALKENEYDIIKTFLYKEDDKEKKASNGSKARKNMEESKKQILSQKKCRRNALNQSKQPYPHTGGPKTMERLKDEEEKKQQRRIGRREMFIMTHKKRDGSYINDDAHVVGVNSSSKEISLTDSLAQVLGKEHLGRVGGLGFGSYSTKIISNTTQQLNSIVQIEEYQSEIIELKAAAAEQKAEISKLKATIVEHRAEAAEEKAKRQTMKNLVKYIIQQQRDTLPPKIDAQLKSLESGAK